MEFHTDAFVDFVGSLALLALLASSYGALSRRMLPPKFATVVLGCLFGVVALLQMIKPLELLPGLLMDMRNIPIVLAGAFLGWRGLLPCIAIAICTRLGIGGLGAVAGSVGIVIAGGVGLYWRKVTKAGSKHPPVALVVLGLAANVHLLSAFVLPRDIAQVFFQQVGLMIIAVNVTVIPVIGYLLRHAQLGLEKERRMALAAKVDPESGLLTEASFERELQRLARSRDPDAVRGVLVIRPHWGRWLSESWGDSLISESQGTLARRLEGLVTHDQKIGLGRGHRIMIPVTLNEATRLSNICRNIHREIGDHRITLPKGQEARHLQEIYFAPVGGDVSIAQLTKVAKLIRPGVAQMALPCLPPRHPNAITTATEAISETEAARLFHKAELFMPTRSA